MWYLTSDNDDRVIYVISQEKEIIIGRSVDNQVCNFAIADDPSISRKHATLTVTDNVLILQDLGSRYGTFINDSTVKVEINTNIPLKQNDVVKFGKMNSIWTVNTCNLNTCTSTLKGENLQKLKLTLSKIGAVFKNEWDDTCNFLTMPAITLTIKVVLALVQGSHIVTTDYWLQFLENVSNFKAMPNPETFMPSVVESTLNKEVVSFLPDLQRRLLFKDKKFVFFSRRQYEMYKSVLIKGGATPLLLGESKMTVTMLCEPNVIVIQYTATGSTQETQAQKNQVADIVNQLKARGKRVIADAEIGLAILYCSTEKYCNPNFSFTLEVVKQNPGPISITSKVLAQESQEPSMMNEKENVKINETYDSSSEKLVSKRKLSEFTSELQFNPNKKVATTCFVANIPSETSKRKLSDDHNVSSNLSKKMAIETMDQESNGAEDKESSNDMFNFINSNGENANENKVKKLNLSRPQKRKIDSSQNDSNLFNFIQTEDDANASEEESTKQSIFCSNQLKKAVDTDAPIVNHTTTITPEEISAMRGAKLKELMQRNMSLGTTMQEFSVKQEKSEDLEEKMSGLDLGSTIVITCNNLIVKKEPFKTEPNDTLATVKNFKTFKKVWPVRKQATIIAPSSMNIADSTDMNYSEAF